MTKDMRNIMIERVAESLT